MFDFGTFSNYSLLVIFLILFCDIFQPNENKNVNILQRLLPFIFVMSVLTFLISIHLSYNIIKTPLISTKYYIILGIIVVFSIGFFYHKMREEKNNKFKNIWIYLDGLFVFYLFLIFHKDIFGYKFRNDINEEHLQHFKNVFGNGDKYFFHRFLLGNKSSNFYESSHKIVHDNIQTYLNSAESDEKEAESDEDIYKEKQKHEFCLLHALNALLQKKHFSKKMLDGYCKKLNITNKTINPHKSVLGTGYYDANVLEFALNEEGIKTHWYNVKNVKKFNLNKAISEISPNHEFIGFIINVRHGLLKRRHWVTLKQIKGKWYNLDSKLKTNEPWSSDAIESYIHENIIIKDGHLIVCTKDISG